MMRLPLLDRNALDPELQGMLSKWEAESVRRPVPFTGRERPLSTVPTATISGR